MPAALTDLVARVSRDPLDPHLLALVVGMALIVLGARIYRIAVVAPGVAIGVLVVVTGAETFAPGVGSARGIAIAALAMGVVGGAVFWFLERFAVASAGAALVGGLVHVFGPALMGGPVPFYVPIGASLLGLLLFPRVYKALLPLLTPLMGALLVGWGLERLDQPGLVLGLAIGGMLVQVIWRVVRGKGDE
jgi:hypothetical protein